MQLRDGKAPRYHPVIAAPSLARPLTAPNAGGRAPLPPDIRAQSAGSNVLRHPILPDRALSR